MTCAAKLVMVVVVVVASMLTPVGAGADTVAATSRASVSSDGVQALGESRLPRNRSLSGDSRYVTFSSTASNLVPGYVNNTEDIFVRDHLLGVTSRVSVSTDGVEANGHCYDAHISSDGRFVTFSSLASNLVPGDTNAAPNNIGYDVFLHDRAYHTTSRVNVSSSGGQADGRSYPEG